MVKVCPHTHLFSEHSGQNDQDSHQCCFSLLSLRYKIFDYFVTIPQIKLINWLINWTEWSYLHIFIFITDISKSQDVQQNTTDLLKIPGQSEELHCSHSSSYNVMLWYKQTRGKGLELIGYLVGSGETVEDKFKTKANLDGNANKNCVLKLKNLSSDDTAVYLCAASRHSAVASLPSQQKPWCINMQLQWVEPGAYEASLGFGYDWSDPLSIKCQFPNKKEVICVWSWDRY